jgi:hypothetical protein
MGRAYLFYYVEHLHGFEVKSYDNFWISDEYGPYIYRFSQTGQLFQTIQPVNAVLPKGSSGTLDFTSERWISPRNPTQRLDALRTKVTFSLFVFPQNSISPPCRIRRSNNRRVPKPNPVRDPSIGHDPRRWQRLALHAALRVRRLTPRCRPPLVGEWVVPLPLSDKGNVEACSEIHFVSPGIFFALSRGGDGRGGGDNDSKYKCAFSSFSFILKDRPNVCEQTS